MGALMDVPMPLCQLVYLTFLSTAVCSLPERILGGTPYNLQMDSHNFQHILSWQAEPEPAVPASYTVLYRGRRSRDWVSAQHCSGIAQLSCELTEQFKDRSSEYSALVQSLGGAQVLNSSVLRFSPILQTKLGPPEVNLTSCLNCINVTMKLPASHFRDRGKLLSLLDIYEELDYEITLKSLDGEHKRPRQKTTEEVFSAVLEDLYPGRNYCVAVAITASLNKNSVPSPWKCVSAASEAQPGYHEVAVAGAVCVSLIIAAVLKCVHAAGFILPKISLPQTLMCVGELVYSPWLCESESVASVEIVPCEVKSKARGCRASDSDSSDSDSSDSSSSCAHAYTRRGGSEPRRCGTPSPPGHCSGHSSRGHSSSQPGAEPAAEPRVFQEQPGGGEDGRREVLSPLSEGSCGSQGSSECFTIGLHTVLLGAPGHDGPGSAAAGTEGAGAWHRAPALPAELLEDTGAGQEAPCSGDFHEWQNSSSSAEDSDSSDSDTELLTGYMRR